MTLIEYLMQLARLWAEANGKSLTRLGHIVAKDGKFFVRVEANKGVQVATWERFLSFFRDQTNWPDGAIPDAAATLLQQVQAIAVVTADQAAGDGPASSDAMVVHVGQIGDDDRSASATKPPLIIGEQSPAVVQAHELFAQSGLQPPPNNSGENIRVNEATDARAAEGAPRGPFSVSASTCSTTPAPSAPCANPACSIGGDE